jgi:hypothetical protein
MKKVKKETMQIVKIATESVKYAGPREWAKKVSDKNG